MTVVIVTIVLAVVTVVTVMTVMKEDKNYGCDEEKNCDEEEEEKNLNCVAIKNTFCWKKVSKGNLFVMRKV